MVTGHLVVLHYTTGYFAIPKSGAIYYIVIVNIVYHLHYIMWTHAHTQLGEGRDDGELGEGRDDGVLGEERDDGALGEG